MRLLTALTTLASFGGLASAASLAQVQDFGQNPTSIQMYIYVPDKVAANPAIIVALHPCGGSAQGWYSGTKLPSYADQLGFILIYPGTTHMSNCWDVQNPASLTHGGGGDAGGIISMVQYTLDKYSGDASKVFVMGGSSGAMMTNVMAGSYPDVFAAGAAFSGVAHACFAGAESATPMSQNQTCAQGKIQHTATEWGNYVRNSYPGYDGPRPRMQIFHGNADNLVYPECAHQALSQWADVFGLQLTAKNANVPSNGYTQEVYGDGTQLQGFFGDGVGHIAPVNEPVILKFFGLTS
ncbi:Alpha/Beta hydrolase protein [Chaetomium sp. MPI-SDFR-AT-0129]|uniref:Carboxylic ester hydrolase n=1 Tax=Dichotomopilus funicola TaxID=1934379 RepID=A0AAN6ZJZ7_9PEZI|nr:Alpha/Beta hydrolase protein [Chaetomium sp. MPI-SDFR-AT-0129]KAK4140181.1 Alpha/Beta hydrolase protein [Dichotomopilus funicola]